MAGDGEMAAPGVGGAASNTSDFVRKLYKMLEDPQYNDIVRWSNNGDSFVVLQNEVFTKDILPKHFKHSNFASFVRQLNKYDFHKVRYTDENGHTPYGQAWEFQHPDFTVHSKNSLDNIRRKAPTGKKAQAADDSIPAQHFNVLTEQLHATTMQVQQLSEQSNLLATQNRYLVDEIFNLQKGQKVMNQVNNELLNHLSQQDERRRNSRHSSQANHSGQPSAFHSGSLNVLPDGNDEPSPALRKAREILNAYNNLETNGPADGNTLPRLSMAYQTNSPPDSATGSTSVMYSQPNSAVLPQTMMHSFSGDDPRTLVYPAGSNLGIDPLHPDHANSLPFALPQGAPPEIPAQLPPAENKAKEAESPWGPRKPRVFLVEDDKTCSRIGSKFLSTVDCNVECAKDGEEATNKLTSDPERFDLIFMDIIMPRCDGISATIYIRSVNTRVPIVAMTSNIRAEDIATYYQWGMNDILAKPFTKDGMIKILKRHCSHLLKHPEAHANDLEPSGMVAPFSSGPSASTPTFGIPPAVTAGGSLKFEMTPTNSPATSTSWHSPGQTMMHASPNLDNNGSYMTAGINVSAGGPQMAQMVSAPGGMPAPSAMPHGNFPPHMQNPAMSRMPVDMGDGPPEKRQRVNYTPAGGPAYRR